MLINQPNKLVKKEKVRNTYSKNREKIGTGRHVIPSFDFNPLFLFDI